MQRRTIAQRFRAKLAEIKAELRRRMHLPVPVQGAWLRSVLLGHYRYYGVPLNAKASTAVPKGGSHGVATQSLATKPERLRQLGAHEAATWTSGSLSPVSIIRIPDERFGVMTSRQEPSAVVPLAGICAGGAW